MGLFCQGSQRTDLPAVDPSFRAGKQKGSPEETRGENTVATRTSLGQAYAINFATDRLLDCELSSYSQKPPRQAVRREFQYILITVNLCDWSFFEPPGISLYPGNFFILLALLLHI